LYILEKYPNAPFSITDIGDSLFSISRYLRGQNAALARIDQRKWENSR